MFAVLHIADFALQAVVRHEPDLARQPVALIDGSRKKALIIAATAAALRVGVRAGMSPPQAQARCAGLRVRPPHPQAKAEARAILLAASLTLSPLIEDTAPGICTVDLQGRDRRDLAPAARTAVDHLARLGLVATAGLAATPLLALYAARSLATAAPDETNADPPDVADSLLLHEEPPDTRVRLVEQPRAFLAPLPLTTASPTAEHLGILTTWGLRTLGDLTALSRAEVGRRLGTEGLALWDRAAGGHPRPLHAVAPPQAFDAAAEFEHPVETLEPLLFVLRRQLGRLALELTAAGRVAAELELTLTLGDGGQHARSFRLPEPTANEELLFRALHTHLETLQTTQAIVGLHLGVRPTRPLVRQQGLFESGLRDPHGFAETLARIVAVVGSDRVGTPHPVNSHRPDAHTLQTPAAVVAPAAPVPLHPPIGPLLRRYRPSLPARLAFTGEQPSYVWTDLFTGVITALHGPWRASGESWQRDRAWTRTEWDIAVENGGLYRLLHDGQAYFIEGEYD